MEHKKQVEKSQRQQRELLFGNRIEKAKEDTFLKYGYTHLLFLSCLIVLTFNSLLALSNVL